MRKGSAIMFHNIKFSTNKSFNDDIKILHENLNSNIEKFKTESTFSNTEGALIWILRGCIDYFNQLDNTFLGESNNSGIPDSKSDYFANNIYRLNNSIKYLSRLWKIENYETDAIKFLLDIRTLLVHSGEPLSKIKSMEFSECKDAQLGRIIRNDGNTPLVFFNEHTNMDYYMTIWNDKHDKSKKYNKAVVDYHINNKSYVDVSIYLKAVDVRNEVLCYIQSFLNSGTKKELKKIKEKLPENIKSKVIDKENHEIDFGKIANLISKSTRGRYYIEDDLTHWSGFGLERMYYYTKNTFKISSEARELILKRIEDTVSDYWDDYQNVEYSDEELPNLDIRRVFRNFTPKYSQKGYLEGEKLFYKITPFFNVEGKGDATDLDYLIMFISKVNNALNIELNLEQSIDGIVCEYFVRSVESSISK